MADGRIWLKAKIPPNKHIIAAYGAAIAGLSTQIAYGGGVRKRHSIALWQHYNGYLTTLKTTQSGSTS